MNTKRLQQGIDLANSGNQGLARTVFLQLTQNEPENEMGWLWLASVANNDRERLSCLQQVLRINPKNQRALQDIRTLQSSASTAANYRFSGEHKTLALTIGAIAIALLVFTTVSLGLFLGITAVMLGINYLLFIRARAEGTMRSALRVTEKQRPDIKALVDECARRVGVDSDTRVFIVQSPVLNAYAFGLGKPYSIILHSALIKHLDADELKSVIGHEMGHIKFGHTNLLTLIGQLGGQTFGIPLVGDLIRYIFLFWERTTEFSADRAGLIACGNLDKAIYTELKLGVGPELAAEVDIHELARTWREEEHNLLGILGEMQSTHPMMLTRIKQMVDFATSEQFRQLCPDARVNLDNARYWTNSSQMDTAGQKSDHHFQPEFVPKEMASRPAPISSNDHECLCPKCQRQIQESWKVCPYCRTRLNQN